MAPAVELQIVRAILCPDKDSCPASCFPFTDPNYNVVVVHYGIDIQIDRKDG